MVVCLCAKSLQSCLTLCDPMGCSPPGSSVCGISRQEYWSGLSCCPPADLLFKEIKPRSLMSPSLAGSLPLVPTSSKTFSSPQRKTLYTLSSHFSFYPPPSPWQPQLTFCLYEFIYYRLFILLAYVTFCVWLLSLSIMFLKFNHITAVISTSFPFMVK